MKIASIAPFLKFPITAPLAVKLETTHKQAKSPTNQPKYPQTSQTTHKPPTN